ncbi:MAG: DNA-processing protein DprA [Nitrospiraceae bacterium]|nr:DNA-processing protein DprA [Nitrospiraceae bacterium]
MPSETCITRDELRCSIGLVFTKDVGPVTYRKLLSKFRSAQNIFSASAGDLAKTADLSHAKASNILEFNKWAEVDQEIKKAEELGISIIPLTDPAYPEQLRPFDDAPIILYVKGSITPDDINSVAVVGSRLMSEYGRSAARQISFGLASSGITIISGMARGIDTTAHESALKAGGRTIAVLGSGLDVPYPSENKKLFAKIAEAGAVISEFPFGTGPLRENFPRRNRLISGLSMGVLVVEAAAGSGSLITASYGLEQGKEIFAVPGSIGQKNSEGTNALIKNGARLVQQAEDIIEELAPKIKNNIRLSTPRRPQEMLAQLDALEISGDEKAICTVLASGARQIDQISRELNISSARLSGILLNLELKGLIRQLDGKKFEAL